MTYIKYYETGVTEAREIVRREGLLEAMEYAREKGLPITKKEHPFISWFREGIEGLGEIVSPSTIMETQMSRTLPGLFPAKEPVTLTALKRIHYTQEWLLGAPLPPLIKLYQPRIGPIPVGKPELKLTAPLEPVAKLTEVAKFPVGVVAPIEAFVSPEVPTPMGAIFSAEQRKQLQELGPFYVGGTLAGEYILGVGFAKVVGKVGRVGWWSVKKVVPAPIKETVAYAVKFGRPAKVVHAFKLWRIEHLPSWKTSRFDVWLAKNVPWYYAKTGGVAVGEVAIPPLTEPISLAQLKASSLAFGMTVAPKTGGVWLGKYYLEPIAKKVWPHLISRVGKVSIGYLREYGFERMRPETGLTPLVSQTQLTRMGIFPYIPKVGAITVARTQVSQIAVGLGASTLLKGLLAPKRIEKDIEAHARVPTPKVWQPIFPLERVKYTPLQIPALAPKKREELIPVLRPKLPQIPKQPELSIMEKPTPQKVIPTPKPFIPVPTIPVPTPAPPIVPAWMRLGGRGFSRMEKRLFGKWFKRKHPIVTPKQMAKTFGLRMPKIKIGKRRKRKRSALPLL